MKIRYAFILSLFLLFSCKESDINPTHKLDCGGVPNVESHPKNAALKALMAEYVKKGLPGMSIYIEDASGVWVGSAGFADIENQIPFTTCHTSKVASLTKMIVGALVLKLQEEGHLNLDDPINKYIGTDILDKIENAEGKTIRQLMNHTTGIFDVITSTDFYLAVLNNPNKNWYQLDLLKYVYGEPGVELGKPYKASYSNTNTLLLSMCIEKALPKPHHLTLREKLIDPLNMTNTTYQGREKTPENAAQGYYDLHNDGTIVNVSNILPGSGNGYNGIYSNVYDLNRFMSAMFTDSVKYLTEASLQTMQEFVQEDEDFHTSPGLVKKFTHKTDYGIGHTGRDLGYVADAFYFPNKKCKMIFLVNYGTDGDSWLKPIFKQFESDLADLVLK